ncbi:MAG TPA: alpha/beta fold hydrolase [Actinomycetota bacterium]|jgi:pimeloyl-ACP methyl ester carboxylesterase|nr:alpha/beta fold hydrolase [Actinomycetota bacterium]
MAPILTRRQALATGAAGAAVALAGGAGLVRAGVLPGRYQAGRLLGACDVGGPPPTTVAPGPLRFASFPSQRRGRPVGYGVAWPPGAGPGGRLGVCLLLHAAAGSERAPFERLRMHHHLAQAVGADGVRPFALASADGRGSDWRPAPGDDPVSMLVDELLPLLSGLGLRTGPGQVAVLGWSMGGAGALRLAEAHPDRLAAVVAASPAVAPAGAEVAAAGRLTGLPVKVDCGANDPWADATRALAAALPTAEAAVTRGCHDGGFWQHLAPAQLRFVAGALGS